MSINVPVRVRHLVEKYGTTDPYRLAKDLHCEIIVGDMPSRTNGMWRRILRRKYIFINERLSSWQQAAVLCHELGHIVCHPTYYAFSTHGMSFSSSRKEQEANHFASVLMSYRYPPSEYYVKDFLERGWKA